MHLLYFGLPLGALLLAQDGHTFAQAIMGRAEGNGLRRLRRLLGDRVSVLPARTAVERAVLAHGTPDLVVSWFFPKKLPPAVLGLGRLGTVGVHPSLLPRHRGADPYFAAIEAGDETTGVTAHRLDTEYDTGHVLDAETLRIGPDWNAWLLARQLDRPSLRVLRRVVNAIGAGTVTERAQDESAATQAPEPTEAELELDVATMSPERALRRIRAAAPWPGAFFFAGDTPVVVERARIAVGASALGPGDLAAHAGSVWLGLLGGALVLERVRVDAGASSGADEDAALEGDALWEWALTLTARA